MSCETFLGFLERFQTFPLPSLMPMGLPARSKTKWSMR